jgi:hypothetical protein
MTPRVLNTISAVAWLTLLLCAGMFLFTAICAPETALVSSASDRDERIRKIESSSDLRLVRGTATGLVQAGYATSSTAMVLCAAFLGTLVLVTVGAIITLVQIRWMRRQSHEQKSNVASYEGSSGKE